MEEPAPGGSTSALRSRLAGVLREKFHWWITAEWICCDPFVTGHKLCKQGHAARRMVASLLADDPEEHPPTSPILDALVAVVEAEIAAKDAEIKRLGAEWVAAHNRATENCKRAEQAEELLAIAHQTANTSERERASAVKRAEEAEERMRRL